MKGAIYMELMTQELETVFPTLYSQEDKDPKDIKVIAKFFDPCGSWTWYATECDPKERLFFGYVRGFENELGYFSLDELSSVKGPLGLGIERDLHFGEHTLAEVIQKRL
jgi:hypothetical protein